MSGVEVLEVRILGQFEVKQNGVITNLPSRPAQSLLALLILNSGTAFRREKLAGLLWPDTTEANARNNLRQALWRIRKALENGSPDEQASLLVDEISIAFNSESGYWLDVAVLERKITRDSPVADLMDCVSVYRGELLPGFYDDWVILERERLQTVFERQMSQLIERLIEMQSFPEVIEWGEHWIAMGGVPEPAYRGVMIAHASLGDLPRAVAVYQRCLEALRRELGVEPSEATRALYEQLRTGRLQSPETALRGQRTGEPLAQDLLAQGMPAQDMLADLSSSALADQAPAPGEPPFKGLHYFDENDADLFFGREQLVAQLIQRMQEGLSLVIVVGASGSGKSSIVRAGLIPAIKRFGRSFDRHSPHDEEPNWRVHVIIPTAHPIEALAVSLTRDSQAIKATTTLIDDLASDPRSLRLYTLKTPGVKHLIIVDQFEELFTLCRGEAERVAFIDNLLTASGFCVTVNSGEVGGRNGIGGSTTVVISLRADFYTHCAQYPGLRQALTNHQEYIGPMSAEELRRAIEEPARVGGWDFEPGLVDLILRDAGEEPGSLPLLSHALLETWRSRSGRTLTLRGYAQAGGVHGAIARTAETVYNQVLSPEQQPLARNIFLRLTELGEGTQDTRRRAAVTELIPRPEQASAIQAVLKILADSRLITISEEAVEVAHEALIREWPALRQWLAEDREGLQLHHRLIETAQAWDDFGRDPSEFLRGTRLAQAVEWSTTHSEELNQLEREYLAASQEWAEREESEREATQQRELEAAQALAETERQRAEEQGRAASALRRRALYLDGAFILALIMAGAALILGNLARQSALTAQANYQQAESERIISFSRELAAAAIANLEVDPERSILLALRAVEVTDEVDHSVLPEAANALHQAVQASRLTRTLLAHPKPVWGLDFSPDGAHLATGSDDGTAKIWDLSTGQEVVVLSGHNDVVSGVAYSPDGTRLATSSHDGKVKVWNVQTGQELPILPDVAQQAGQRVTSVEFSPDGASLASGYDYGIAKVWDLRKGQLASLLGEHDFWVNQIAFSPDGQRMATVSYDGTAKLWDATNGKQLLNLSEQSAALYSVAFSPDGTRLATTSSDSTAKVWDAAIGDLLLTLIGHTNEVFDVAFSPDGRNLATASADGKVIIWEASSGQQLRVLVGHSGSVTNVDFSPDGRRLASSGKDGAVKVWDWASPDRELFTLAGHTGRVTDIAISPDGTRLATTSTDETAKVWDAATGQELFALLGGGNSQPLTRTSEIVFSPDSQRLATIDADGLARVWDAANGRELFGLEGHNDRVWDVEFSPDGRRLATGSEDITARIWDGVTGQELLTLRGHTGPVLDVAFNPDGSLLATASADWTAKLWDASTGKELHWLGGHTHWLTRVVFNQDGSRLATLTGERGTFVRVWDTASGQMLQKLEGHGDQVWDADFSPDGRLIATASEDGTAKVWNVETGEQVFNLVGHSSTVWRVLFGPDGALLATASGDGTVKIWDVSTGQELFSLTGHTNLVTAIAFSSDGRHLYTASDDGTTRAYLLPINELMDLARARLTRTWTEVECQKFLHLPQGQCPAKP